jgi:hypothetical protein
VPPGSGAIAAGAEPSNRRIPRSQERRWISTRRPFERGTPGRARW